MITRRYRLQRGSKHEKASPHRPTASDPRDDEKVKEKAADWIIEKAGELGITDDIITKRHMLDAYCG